MKQDSIRLPEAARTWGSQTFEATFRRELADLGLAGLPLQEGLTQGSQALGDNLDVTILAAEANGEFLRLRAGLFYASVIAGCSCADDPSPIDEQPEYCEVEVEIALATGVAAIRLAG